MQTKPATEVREVTHPYNTSPIVVASLVGLLIVAFANSLPIARYGMFAVIGLVLISLFFNKNTYWGHRGINAVGVLLIIYNVAAIFFHIPTQTSTYNGFLFIAMVALFLAFSSMQPEISHLNSFIQLMSKIAWPLLLFGFYLEVAGSSFDWDNKTGFLFCYLFFVFLNKKTNSIVKLIYFTSWLGLAYLADDRAYVIAGLVLVVAYFLWPALARFKYFGTIVFLIFLSALVLVPVSYVQLSLSEHRNFLDELSLKYTDGRFFSGRDVIWRYMLEDFSETNFFLGGGHAVAPPALFGTALSSHNTYMSVLTRTGIIGLVLFLMLFFVLLKKYQSFSWLFEVRLSASFTIALLFKQSSELSLIGNNIAGSVFSWLVMAFGLIYINAVIRIRAQDGENVHPIRLEEINKEKL